MQKIALTDWLNTVKLNFFKFTITFILLIDDLCSDLFGMKDQQNWNSFSLLNFFYPACDIILKLGYYPPIYYSWATSGIKFANHTKKVFVEDFISKCKQIWSFLWICLHFLEKSLKENFIYNLHLQCLLRICCIVIDSSYSFWRKNLQDFEVNAVSFFNY